MPDDPPIESEDQKSRSKEVRKKVEKMGFGLAQMRRYAEETLAELEALATLLDPKSLRWRCDGCGYTKHFTKPTTLVACDQCPRCKGVAFSPVAIS